MNVREQRAESQQVEAKYLDVLEAGQKIAEENDAMIARLDYRKVATHYGCAYKNDGYRFPARSSTASVSTRGCE
ncbi:hypothetical protein [Halomicrococcus sp. NG-SE-24]|uniref:hypothetical protein n=1 Tax=Halomicrococcus sp. NG-SE-24 TaxID=3436928 RepID=UPI003D96F970